MLLLVCEPACSLRWWWCVSLSHSMCVCARACVCRPTDQLSVMNGFGAGKAEPLPSSEAKVRKTYVSPSALCPNIKGESAGASRAQSVRVCAHMRLSRLPK